MLEWVSASIDFYYVCMTRFDLFDEQTYQAEALLTELRHRDAGSGVLQATNIGKSVGVTSNYNNIIIIIRAFRGLLISRAPLYRLPSMF